VTRPRPLAEAGNLRTVLPGHHNHRHPWLPARLPQPSAPSISYANCLPSPSAALMNTPHSPGTLSITATTLAAIITDIADSLTEQGVAGLIIVNAHGGNAVLTNIHRPAIQHRRAA
jgi:Creatinine amidohydrolase